MNIRIALPAHDTGTAKDTGRTSSGRGAFPSSAYPKVLRALILKVYSPPSTGSRVVSVS